MINQDSIINNPIKDVDIYFIKLGLSGYRKESLNHRLFRYFFKINLKIKIKELKIFRYSIVLSSVLFMLKCTLSIMIYTNQSNVDSQLDIKLLSHYLGDLTFYIPDLRLFYNLIVIVFILQILSIQILYNLKYDYKWLKPFQMLSGCIRPIELGFEVVEDADDYFKRFFLLFNKLLIN